jgi:S1-C subfamily serine protease
VTLAQEEMPVTDEPTEEEQAAPVEVEVAEEALPEEDPDLENTLVRVLVTYQTFDPIMPWQQTSPRTRYGYGVFVTDSLVLTTEDTVRNHRFVELRQSLSGEKFTAKVVEADEYVNLALLKVRRSGMRGEPKPLIPAEKLDRAARMIAAQFDETGEIQTGTLQIEKISMASLPSAAGSSLSFRLRTRLNINGDGAPVLADGKLVGLVSSYRNSRRTASVVPYPVIRRFLDDASDAPYKGFAAAGFSWGYLLDPAKRKYLQIDEERRGVIVLATTPGTGASEVLEPEDVILEWDGVPIDNMGYYDDPDFGRLVFSYLIKGRGRPGDMIPVTLVRDGEVRKVKLRLIRPSDARDFIPENTLREPIDYLVDGGLVIRELTGNFLRQYGKEWQMRVDSRIAHLYLTRSDRPEKPGDRLVILAQVLPDPINAGYEFFRNQIITHVNSQPVRNMQDVFRIVERDGNVNRLTLKSIGVDLVLDESGMRAANKRLAAKYSILRMRHRVSGRKTKASGRN